MAKRKQTIERGAAGLYSFPNRLMLPPGALVKARNAVMYRPGIISKRRGYNRYGDALAVGAKALSEHEKRIVVLDGTTLKYDSDGAGTWASWPGSYSPPSGRRVTFLEMNQNLYFITDAGVQKVDGLGNTPVRAGMPQGLDLRLTLAGTGDEWFTPGTQVGYRVVWKRKDAKDNVLLGAPSFREKKLNPNTAVSLAYSNPTVTVTHTAHGYTTGDIVELSDLDDADYGLGPHEITVTGVDTYTYTDNLGATPGATATGNAGKKLHVTVEFSVPTQAGIQSGDYYQIYRTKMSASASTDPGDRHYLVEELEYTSGTLLTYTDTQAEGHLEQALPLYTNDTSEGSSQASDRPPWCKLFAEFKGHVFYGNFLQEHFLEIKLLRTTGLTAETDTITISAPGEGTRVYTFSATEDAASGRFKLYTTADSDTPTSAQVTEYTMKSFCRVVNQDANSTVYAYYISGINDLPGKVLLKRFDVKKLAFTVSSLGGDQFSPDLTSAVTSDNKTRKHGVLRSKYQEPEAVPAANEHFAGRADRDLLGMVALSDTLFLIKEDGIYKLTGDSDLGAGRDFRVEPADLTIRPLAKHSYVGLDNAVYGYTTHGVIRVVESGAVIASDPIENYLYLASVASNFSNDSFGVAYEKDHFYIFFTPDISASHASLGWAYNYIRKTWGQIDKPVTCGYVLSSDDKLYLGHAFDGYVLKERKNFNSGDYVDETLDCTVTSFGTTTNEWGQTVSTCTVTFSYWKSIDQGWLFAQGDNNKALVDIATDNGDGTFDLTLSRQITIANGAATVGIGINMEIEWAAEAGGNAAASKQYSACQLTLEADTALHHRFGFQANHQLEMEFVDLIHFPEIDGWGQFPWGQEMWGQPFARNISHEPRTAIPLDHQRCELLSVYYQNKFAEEEVNILQLALDVRLYGPRTGLRTEPV